MTNPSPALRLAIRIAVAIFFVAGGLAHLIAPDTLLRIAPGWVPFPRETILVTGVLEIAGAAALFVPPLARIAGIALALYALCVWPANFKHALDAIDLPYISSSWWYHAPRLALQPVVAWAALFAGGAVEWPWRRG
jgi:uncharacterized membrane protein